MTNHAEPKTIAVGEKDYIGFRFIADDLPAGVTVLSAAISVLPASGLTLGAIGLLTEDSDGAYVWITGVTPGTYVVKLVITFSDTKVLVRNYPVRVE